MSVFVDRRSHLGVCYSDVYILINRTHSKAVQLQKFKLFSMWCSAIVKHTVKSFDPAFPLVVYSFSIAEVQYESQNNVSI
mmetsp:Transcript_664/g.1592  ORF Transcript_664/g.1592 Transcript_664/m.1592 type:complete len:80 (+) Transcript_664:1530-1769(+)